MGAEPGMGVYVTEQGWRRAPWEVEVKEPRVGDVILQRHGAKPVVEDGAVVDLVTPEEFETLPAGTRLVSIFGEEAWKGDDEIDVDTRFGFMAWGLLRG